MHPSRFRIVPAVALQLLLAGTAGVAWADQTHRAGEAGQPAAATATRETAGAEKERSTRNRGSRDKGTDSGSRRTSYPHGGWVGRQYLYYPDAGFGRTGAYSWYYGQPYAYSYPYGYYGPSSYVTPPYAGTMSTSLPAWMRFTPGGMNSIYSSFRFAGPQVSAFHVWNALSPRGGYPGTAGFASYQPWFSPMATDLYPQASASDAWVSGYLQALSEAEQQKRQPWAAVTLKIEPSSALMWIDGNPIGTAEQFAREGARLTLPAGQYHLEVSATGYEPQAIDLTLLSGQVLTVERTLQKIAPEDKEKSQSAPSGTAPAASATPERPRGEVLLVVSPADAKVTVDGRFVCRVTAPGEEFRCRLPAGPHTMEVTRDGYRTHKEEVIVSPLQPLGREVRLQPR